MTATYEQGQVVTISSSWEAAVDDLLLTIRQPDQTLIQRTFAQVDQDSPTSFHYNHLADQPGDYYYLWRVTSPGQGTIEGTFTVDPNQTTLAAVTDPTDIRVMIPRVRRALEGPGSTGPLAGSAVLTDDEVGALIADAISDIILYTGSAFGHTLLVTHRDAFYMAPDAWATSEELSLTEQSVIVAQTALGYFFHKLKDLKVQEEIADEASTWSYQLSSTLIRDQMRLLQDARDRALAAVEAAATVALDSYVSFVSVRDARTSALVEPWIQGAIGGLQGDYRFA